MIIPLGIVFLLFRIWLVEFRLVDELQFRRHYLSRFMNYYAGLALSFGLTINILNIIVIISFPILVVTVGWDINFYRNFRIRTYWTKNKRWMLLERLTLHPPVFLLGLLMIIVGAQSYIRPSNLLFIGLAAILLYIPFFLFDVRWRERYSWPQALTIIMLVGLSSLSLAIAEFILWGVPLW
ncbi:hypothetical protein EU527_01435 [Candidatus Thorarchaeota archaeon]|nr:MAG: hypothetical protein EU527_01435 [Candidatus Thorarchaeota archaeon]